jgi:NADH-quinone oxidoreductase subunit M
MTEFFESIPILSIITYLPLAGALVLLLIPRENTKAFIHGATWIAFVDMLISLPLWWAYRTDEGAPNFQFIEQANWIDAIHVQYKFGVDGISLLLVLLTTILGFISILSSWTAIKERQKEYYIFFLLLQTGMLGVFCALDLFLFYIFWEVMLVPMYFLIGVWGGPRRLYAAIKFFLYTLFGSVLMLLGILWLYFNSGEALRGILTELPEGWTEWHNTFDINLLQMMGPYTAMAGLAGTLVFLAFFLGFAIKVPMFPFHTWLPDAHVEAPTAGSVILAGVLLKMGTYGFVRFSLPIFPQQTLDNMWWLLSLCIVGIIYGALVAMAQKDWKKLVAYSSVSHLGMTMIGVFALNLHGIEGGVLTMINHGISTGGLFLIVGLIYERRHTRIIADYGGLAKVVPIFAIYFMIITLSSIGLPAMNGFIGEITILAGIFTVTGEAFSFFGWSARWWTVLAATGIVLGAAYMLWLYQRTMFGKVDKEENLGIKDLNFREKWTLIPLVVLVFWIGLYPRPFFNRMEPSVTVLVEEQIKPVIGDQIAPPAHHAAADLEAPAPEEPDLRTE